MLVPTLAGREGAGDRGTGGGVAGQGEGGDSLLVPALAGREGADRGTGGGVQAVMHVKAGANGTGDAEASRRNGGGVALGAGGTPKKT
jgi:hypothetical protein